MRLLLDVPEEQPIFGFDEYASALVSAILGTEPHFTIGIFGKWGSGKTTLLKKTESLLKSSYSEKVLTVFFDAWRYQREEHMALPILDTLFEHLRQKQAHWRELGDKLKRLTASIATAMTVKLPLLELDTKNAVKEWRATNEQVRSDYFGWLTELQKALDDVRRGDPDRRIVFLIDDLDRCLPPKVVEVLESIKVLLDVAGLVFVLALDESVAEQAIQSYYGKDYGVPPRDYVKKLVQVEFRLPPLRTQDVMNYVEVLQQRVGHILPGHAFRALALVVPRAVGDNPRDVKRFVNAALLGTTVMRNIGIRVPVNQQIAFMAMEFRWPGIARVLAGDRAVWNVLREYTVAKAQGRPPTLSEKEGKNVKEILENKPGLDAYLQEFPGRLLLDLSEDAFNELVYYASITSEKTRTEIVQVAIDEALNELTDHEKRVLQLLFGLRSGRPRTAREVGREFNRSAQRIEETAGKAMRKLRHPTRARKLHAFLSSLDELDYPSRTFLVTLFSDQLEQYGPTK